MLHLRVDGGDNSGGLVQLCLLAGAVDKQMRSEDSFSRSARSAGSQGSSSSRATRSTPQEESELFSRMMRSAATDDDHLTRTMRMPDYFSRSSRATDDYFSRASRSGGGGGSQRDYFSRTMKSGTGDYFSRAM